MNEEVKTYSRCFWCKLNSDVKNLIAVIVIGTAIGIMLADKPVKKQLTSKALHQKANIKVDSEKNQSMDSLLIEKESTK